ncbi:MAG: hypothetical protein J2P30_05315, partial [Actinobacteria bacterium]|nr:hypothetical protein [Actinomycetota bacterium]
MPALPPERPGCPKAPGEHRPLPDPAAVRLYLVPESAPPYDDEVPGGEPPGRYGGAVGNARPWDEGRPVEGGPVEGGPVTGERGAGGPIMGEPGTGGPITGRLEAGGPRAGRPEAGGPR